GTRWTTSSDRWKIISARRQRRRRPCASISLLAVRAGQVSLDRKFDQPDEVMDVQLAHEAGAVGIDGLRADIEQFGDIFGAPPIDEQREDLHLAPAQAAEWVGIAPAFLLFEETGAPQ